MIHIQFYLPEFKSEENSTNDHIINQVHPVLSPNLGLVNLDVVVQYLGFSGGNIFSLLDDPNNRLDVTLRAPE
jgi:hypothetical protein